MPMEIWSNWSKDKEGCLSEHFLCYFDLKIDILCGEISLAMLFSQRWHFIEFEWTSSLIFIADNLRSLKSKICKFSRFFKFQLINFSDLQFPRFSHSFREYFQDQLFEKHADSYQIRNVNLIISAYLPILIEF